MGELEILFRLIGALFKAVFWLIAGVFRLLRWSLRSLERLGDEELRRQRTGAPGRSTPPTLKTHPPRPSTGAPRPKLDDLVRRAVALDGKARTLARLCDERVETARFRPTLEALIERLDPLLRRLRRGEGKRAGFERELEREETLAELVQAMVAERRGPLTELLGDADALANAAYAPIVEFCGRRGIALLSDRAATILDGDKLFFYSVSDPSGLAAIVLPTSFASEIIAWPAIAHEIAHDFFGSVHGLPSDLRRALHLGNDFRLTQLTGGRQDERELQHIPERAVAAWMEELFADAFGTLMLGPAYIETMARLFASPDEPTRALAVGVVEAEGKLVYEEHPPAHVRVVSGCRLLARMGYGREADALEAAWRRTHGEPDRLFVPLTDGRWLSVGESLLIDRACQVGEQLYLVGLPCLREQPLRSIPGLDFGPREHEAARRIAARFVAGQAARPTDPRLLIAGAVLATAQAPERSASIYALAREAVIGVDARRPGEPSSASVASDEPLGPIDGAALREAFLLGEVLGPPRARR